MRRRCGIELRLEHFLSISWAVPCLVVKVRQPKEVPAMRRLLAIALTSVLTALVVPTSALADTSEVSAQGCQNQGAHVFRPAGTEIVVRQGLIFKSQGLTNDFLQAQSSALSVNGGTAIDVSGFYSRPTEVSGVWSTVLRFPTGITLASGESMTFHLVISLSHAIVDGITFENGESGKPVFYGPGVTFDLGTCTVTGT
jgi:hypothetical protein